MFVGAGYTTGPTTAYAVYETDWKGRRKKGNKKKEVSYEFDLESHSLGRKFHHCYHYDNSLSQ